MSFVPIIFSCDLNYFIMTILAIISLLIDFWHLYHQEEGAQEFTPFRVLVGKGQELILKMKGKVVSI